MRSGRNRQCGATLVSLMVGLVVSMVAVLGMLALYRTAVQVTSESTRYARVTGDRAAAIINAETLLQNAGYGIDGAVLASAVVLCDDISAGSNGYQPSSCTAAIVDQQQPVMIWRFATLAAPLGSGPAASRCEGLAIENGQLLYLHALPCASTTALPSWSHDDVSVLFATSGLAGGVFAGIELESEPCAAFGVGGTGTIMATLEAHHPITDDPEDYRPTDPATFRQFFSRTCLTNIGGS
ncbi:hypothetical protein QAO71_13190 [Halopseudomonas sp. SMJS2]|uniref:PilW family protein n=1 Tax=Halopseudomonas sp. SMJS2 TaxID=3041098 RepID=UPI0024532206|nr:hypothetical protein [Halopseudomonas sp. SMJS2]WGK61011.1 hypothetical protein QAO71_13190 [Halopseudomonas sp. SMJS2]